MKKYICIFCLILIGCASTSDVIPVGENKYHVSSEMGGQLSSWSQVKGLSLKKANEYCSNKNQIMEVDKWETHGARGWTPLNAELTFKCIDKKKP